MYIIIKGAPFASVEQAFAVCTGETYVNDYGFVTADADDMRPIVEIDIESDDVRPLVEVDVDYDDRAEAHKALRELRTAFPSAEIEFI